MPTSIWSDSDQRLFELRFAGTPAPPKFAYYPLAHSNRGLVCIRAEGFEVSVLLSFPNCKLTVIDDKAEYAGQWAVKFSVPYFNTTVS